MYYATEGGKLLYTADLVKENLIEPGEYDEFTIEWDEDGYAKVFKGEGKDKVQLYPETDEK